MKALQVIALVLIAVASTIFVAERATGWITAYQLSKEQARLSNERARVIIAREMDKIWSQRSEACSIRYGGTIAADRERNQCCRANPPPGMAQCEEKLW